MSDWRALGGAALALGLLLGCGQKGALYLPDRSGSVVTRPGESFPPRNAPAQPEPPASSAPAPAHPSDSSDADASSPNH